MARVLISDKLSDEGLAILAAAPGLQFDHKPGLSADELKKILPDYDGLIIRSGTKVTADVVAAGKKLRVIGRAGMQALGLPLVAPDAPAFACTAVALPTGVDGERFVRHARDVYGITFMGGQGKLTGRIFRVGHMGDVDGFDMISAVAAVEMTLADLGHPVRIGEGTRAATELLRKTGFGKG